MPGKDDGRDTGLPTRAIHEAYLSMQEAHRSYRRARDRGDDTHRELGELQDTVLTAYELLRPHLKHESELSDYWSGNVPDYTGWDFDTEQQAIQYVREKSTGVYQVQSHTNLVQVEQQTLDQSSGNKQTAAADGGFETLEQWHNYLGLSWRSERLLSIQPIHDDEYTHAVKLLRLAILPLQQLDRWQARITRERESGDGFMSSKTTVKTRREFEPAQKVIAAKRLLVEAADKLGALSEFEASRSETEITREDINKLEKWRQKQLE